MRLKLINKRILSCFYQEQIGAGSYDTNKNDRKAAALNQVVKKEKLGTIDLEAMNSAFNRYLEEIEKEFTEYLEGL